MSFPELAILLGAAALGGIVAKLIRQPPIIGYLFAGFVLAALGLVNGGADYEPLSKIGITLLLFLVGIELNLSELPFIGKVALITGILQIIVTFTLGFLLASLLGFGALPAIYIAVGLTFSSTVIIVKLLSEKNDLRSLYGKISIGILLVQDLVAVVILMFLAGIANQGFGPGYLFVAARGIALFLVIWFLSRKVLPSFFARVIDQSTELIFVVSIAWVLVVAALVAGPLGFSVEIGGFLAGVALSNLPEHLQIATRTRPLRDFFLTLFFLLLGRSLVVGHVGSLLVPALVFSLFVLFVKPLVVLLIMRVQGFRKRTNFMTSINSAQISEFSLILVAAGLALNHVTQTEVSLMVLVGVVTMTLSSYLIVGADGVYERLKKALPIFEGKNKKPEATRESSKKGHIVLVGGHRTGRTLLSLFKKRKEDFVVVDYNPDLASELTRSNIPVIFGDITEEDILSEAGIDRAKLVISTTADLHDNLTLLSYIKGLRPEPLSILKAQTAREAALLYQKGAGYVIVPEVVAGEHIRHILKTYGFKPKKVKALGAAHAKRLEREAVNEKG